VTRKAKQKTGIASRAGTNGRLKNDDHRAIQRIAGDGEMQPAAHPSSGTVTTRANGHSNGHAKRQLATMAVAKRENHKNVLHDQKLVDNCIAGDVAAWSRLYQQCHDRLLSGLRVFLGPAGQDANLVEEIAARTWYALVRNGFALLSRFDAKHGCRLTTFLSVLAKNEARQLLRSERRRKSREQVASRPETEVPKAHNLGSISDAEFIATLTPAERTYCTQVLFAGHEEPGATDYSQVNQWQLRHRIRKKLEGYLA
jgi:DNA-directed RNA polymerase specialized sigma24 family protein